MTVTGLVPVFYATTEGQTRRIAERMAERLRGRGLDSRAIEITSDDAAAIDWRTVSGALVGASLHAGQHQAAAAFVRAHAGELNALPSAFFSVSLSAASANPAEVQTARRLADEFPVTHGWQPVLVAPLGGRLAYTQYNVFLRYMMRRIAPEGGRPHGHEPRLRVPNWDTVDRLVADLAQQLPRAA